MNTTDETRFIVRDDMEKMLEMAEESMNNVLELTDDSGRKFTVGNQEDIGTFNDILLSRV